MAAVVALALLPLALTAASDCEEGLCPVSHLQVQSAVHRTADSTDRAELERQGICKAQLTAEEIRTPILQLMAGSPKQDGWCLYGILGPWASVCAQARKEQNVRLYTELMHQSRSENLHAQKRLEFSDGRALSIRDRENAEDDIYCFANGYYNLSRAEVVGDYQALEEASRHSCSKLAAEFPNYESLSLADLMKASTEDAISTLMSDLEPAAVDSSMLQSMRLQAAVRCLLSSGSAGPAMCDVAYCARRGCLNEQNQVGYTVLGECPDV
eukprot:CAMPEP_0181444904 /NCGR_PEP_ID=MMETSP1110-20121109/25314_1 /TAXON_ID=174948 /ORGANISM="Symbiodinium sp., Strain CCMP421" /LENGTH=268 /DNA_ID=CAMNT_0023568935 /DNA_START=37 /DNA_END=843 /DNA_ORIENTATION=+